MNKCTVFRLVTLLAIGCSSAGPHPSSSGAPWNLHDSLPASGAPVLMEQWRAAENRSSCAPLLLDPTSIPAEASARPATFAGGWGVAWDLPGGPGVTSDGRGCTNCGRGAFGLAGTGVSSSGGVWNGFSNEIDWDDESWARYGRDGSDTKWLAYVHVAGQDCLYNVWSYRSLDHLESLLSGLRLTK